MASTICERGPALRVLIVVASLSGNTRELGRCIERELCVRGHRVQLLDADAPGRWVAQDLQQCDLLLLGSWTDNAGRTPVEMKAWVAAAAGAGQRPAHVAVFGTGETQWGLEYYCGAVHRLARYFASDYPVLEIEQMPHGQHHARAIHGWTDAVLAAYWRNTDVDHRRRYG